MYSNRGTFQPDRINRPKEMNPEINHFCEKMFTQTERLDGNFQTIPHNGKHFKCAFVIYLKYVEFGVKYVSRLARYAVLPRSRHLG